MTRRYEFRGLSDGRTYTTTVIEAADFDAACAKAQDMLRRAVCHIDACVVTDRDDLMRATSARFERD